MKLTQSAEPFTYAQSVAADFNARHGAVFLRAVNPQQESLSHAEVLVWRSSPDFRPGQYLATAVVEQIRGRKAEHGESIAAGRLLKSHGYPAHKSGPVTLYTLDKLPLAGAD